MQQLLSTGVRTPGMTMIPSTVGEHRGVQGEFFDYLEPAAITHGVSVSFGGRGASWPQEAKMRCTALPEYDRRIANRDSSTGSPARRMVTSPEVDDAAPTPSPRLVFFGAGHAQPGPEDTARLPPVGISKPRTAVSSQVRRCWPQIPPPAVGFCPVGSQAAAGRSTRDGPVRGGPHEPR